MRKLVYLLRSGVLWLPLACEELCRGFIAEESAHAIEPASDADIVVGTY